MAAPYHTRCQKQALTGQCCRPVGHPGNCRDERIEPRVEIKSIDLVEGGIAYATVEVTAPIAEHVRFDVSLAPMPIASRVKT
jgi:hypothetical protein